MVSKNVFTLGISAVITAVVVPMMRQFHGISITECLIVATVMMIGLNIAWWNNPYAYDVAPLEKLDKKEKGLYWTIWALNYVPVFVYLQFADGDLMMKIILMVIFLTGSLMTKRFAKKILANK